VGELAIDSLGGVEGVVGELMGTAAASGVILRGMKTPESAAARI
jgi:hypothetical protein